MRIGFATACALAAMLAARIAQAGAPAPGDAASHAASDAASDAGARARQTAAAVRAADLAFAAHAARDGVAVAFRAVIDAEGLEFNGTAHPARGPDAVFADLGGGKPERTSLAWVPTHAWGSSSGDMGVTSGDYALTRKGEAAPFETGRYVTVWRRDAQGAWKALIDIGETDAKPIANAVQGRPGQPPAARPGGPN